MPGSSQPYVPIALSLRRLVRMKASLLLILHRAVREDSAVDRAVCHCVQDSFFRLSRSRYLSRLSFVLRHRLSRRLPNSQPVRLSWRNGTRQLAFHAVVALPLCRPQVSANLALSCLFGRLIREVTDAIVLVI